MRYAVWEVEAEVRFLADLTEGNLLAEPVVAGDWLRIVNLSPSTVTFHSERLTLRLLRLPNDLELSKSQHSIVGISPSYGKPQARSREGP